MRIFPNALYWGKTGDFIKKDKSFQVVSNNNNNNNNNSLLNSLAVTY